MANAEHEIHQVRRRLLARGAELRERLGRVRQDLRRESNPLPRDDSDAAIVVENDEILQAIEESALGELRRIDVALERIASGDFAHCEDCGHEIGRERLSIVPHATRCRDCEPS